MLAGWIERVELERVAQDYAAKESEPSFVVGAHYLSEDEAVSELGKRRVVALSDEN